MMSFPWQQLNDVSQIDQIKAASYTAPQVIFKHSIRCNISSVALRRFESSDPIAGVVYHFIDLINYRTVSNTVADVFKVYHESPQVLVISKGECIYDESHLGIQASELLEQLEGIAKNN